MINKWNVVFKSLIFAFRYYIVVVFVSMLESGYRKNSWSEVAGRPENIESIN